MRRFFMCQQIYLLALPHGLGVDIFLYAVAVLILLPVEIVLVMEDIVFPVLSSGDCANLCHLSRSFGSIFESGNDESISPEEKDQPKRCAEGRKDGEQKSGPSPKNSINAVNDPGSEDHHEEVLGEIVCGDNA